MVIRNLATLLEMSVGISPATAEQLPLQLVRTCPAAHNMVMEPVKPQTITTHGSSIGVTTQKEES